MTAGSPVTDPTPFTRQIMFALLAALVVVVAGCGDGGGDEQIASVAPSANPPATSPPTTSPNQAPAISGTASGQVMVGVAYSFQPSSSDADNNTLTFSIS